MKICCCHVDPPGLRCLECNRGDHQNCTVKVISQMKLYISGAIAADPNFRSKFKHWQKNLEAAGFETVNPVEVNACLDQSCNGEIIDTDTEDNSISEFIHTWQCYMRHDLAVMLACDGVAALPDAMESPGARAEMYIAGLVGIPVKPIRTWVTEAAYNTRKSEPRDVVQS